jgi:hypothetical protein
MAKPFTSIPSISLAELNRVDSKDGDGRVNTGLRNKLDQAFMEVGFAYLTDLPGIFDEGSDLYIPWDVMIKCCKMLCGPDYRGEKEKMAAAKQVFCKSNQNTYRGYVRVVTGPSPTMLIFTIVTHHLYLAVASMKNTSTWDH